MALHQTVLSHTSFLQAERSLLLTGTLLCFITLPCHREIKEMLVWERGKYGATSHWWGR